MIAGVNGLVSKLRAGLERHRDKTPAVVLEKAVKAAAALALGPVMLRACNEVGPRARSLGRTIVENRGRIAIGSDFAANSTFAPVELASGEGGEIAIGDQVTINYGTTITATREVRLGDRVSIGPYCVLCDSDAPAPLDAPNDGRGRAIVIEDGVWLAGRVTVLPGAHIGAGATVSAGSIVSGYIPPGTVAAGIPARPLRVPGAGREGRLAPSREGRQARSPEEARLRGVLVADFPAGELADRLRDEEAPLVDVKMEGLSRCADGDGDGDGDGNGNGNGNGDGNGNGSAPGKSHDLAVVWIAPENALPALKELLAGAAPSEVSAIVARVVEQADTHARFVADRFSVCPCVVVPTWTVAPELRSAAVAHALAAANARLAERLAESLPAARVIDASRFCDRPEAWSPVMRYSTGVPFSLEALAGAARDIKDALRESRGETRTALFLDTPKAPSDTASRAATADLEQALSALRRRGVAIHTLEPGQLPSPERLALTPSKCVLIALDVAARARAREAFPDMLVPEVPSDPLLLARSVRALRAFGGT